MALASTDFIPDEQQDYTPSISAPCVDCTRPLHGINAILHWARGADGQMGPICDRCRQQRLLQPAKAVRGAKE